MHRIPTFLSSLCIGLALLFLFSFQQSNSETKSEATAIQSLPYDTTEVNDWFRKSKAFFRQAVYDSSRVYLQQVEDFYEEKTAMYRDSFTWANYRTCKIELSYWLERQQRTQDAEKVITETLHKFVENFDSLHFLAAELYRQKGLIVSHQNRFDEAMGYHQTALAINKKHSDKDSVQVANCYLSLGGLYDYKGQFEESIDHYEKALKIYQQSEGNEERIAVCYYNIGFVYWRSADFLFALEYYQKALPIYEKVYGKDHNRVGDVHASMAAVYKRLGQYEKAITNYNKVLPIFKKHYGEGHRYMGIFHNYQGEMYKMQNQIDEAQVEFEKAIEIFKNTYGEKHRFTTFAYSNLAHIHIIKQEYEEALELYESALSIKLELYGPKHHEPGKSFNNLSRFYLKQKDYFKALEYSQQAMATLTKDFIPEDVYNNPRITDAVNNKPMLLRFLEDKAFIFEQLYKEDPQEKYLHAALDAANTATDFIENIRQNTKRTASKRRLAGTHFPFYEIGTRAALNLNKLYPNEGWLEKAYAFPEKKQAIVMLEALKSVETLDLGILPPDILQKEADLQDSVLTYEKLVFTEKESQDTSISPSQSQLFHFQQEYDKFIASLEEEYPEYYEVKYDVNVIGPKEIQQILPAENTTLLEYFVGDSSIFVFAINPSEYQVFEIKKDFPLEEWVSDLLESPYSYSTLSQIRNQDRMTELTEQMLNNGYQLYQKIIAPIEEKLTLSEQLIIVPDGVLGYLPFELLLKEKPTNYQDFGGHRYMLRDHLISYCHSTTLLKRMIERQHEASSGNFIAFAPSFEDIPQFAEANLTPENVRGALGPLKYNIPEVQSIQQLLGGNIFTDFQATVAKFKEESPSYKIIHLATHGKANDEEGDYAYLAFSKSDKALENEKLFNRDLYNIRLNADLVVLSACETGIGELKRGEGIISLARGFSFAGAKSIVTTLWSVNDKGTKELMENFYTYLKNGATKDAALRQAKLDYLDKYSYDAHPFYWAAFVPIGDMESVEMSGWNWWWWGTLVLGLSMLVMFFIIKKN